VPSSRFARGRAAEQPSGYRFQWERRAHEFDGVQRTGSAQAGNARSQQREDHHSPRRRSRPFPRRDAQRPRARARLRYLSQPAPGGIEATQRIKRELPSAGIIVFAANEDEDALFDAIKAGAAAFILKDVAPDDLVTIIRRVANGEYLINDKVFAKPAVASRVLKEFRELAIYGQEAAPIFAPLSPREVEILDNIAQGMTNKQVAYALSISEQTVKNHMSSILRKLSVNDRTQAVVYAMRQGWIRMPED
jgi:DNA-binding NarL/FixJ family response regulator